MFGLDFNWERILNKSIVLGKNKVTYKAPIEVKRIVIAVSMIVTLIIGSLLVNYSKHIYKKLNVPPKTLEERQLNYLKKSSYECQAKYSILRYTIKLEEGEPAYEKLRLVDIEHWNDYDGDDCGYLDTDLYFISLKR